MLGTRCCLFRLSEGLGKALVDDLLYRLYRLYLVVGGAHGSVPRRVQQLGMRAFPKSAATRGAGAIPLGQPLRPRAAFAAGASTLHAFWHAVGMAAVGACFCQQLGTLSGGCDVAAGPGDVSWDELALDYEAFGRAGLGL